VAIVGSHPNYIAFVRHNVDQGKFFKKKREGWNSFDPGVILVSTENAT
jgi:hypothetical protein